MRKYRNTEKYYSTQAFLLINCIIIQTAFVNHWHVFWGFIWVIKIGGSDCSWWISSSLSWLFSKFDDKHCNMSQPIRLVSFQCGPQSRVWLWKWQEILIKRHACWIERWQPTLGADGRGDELPLIKSSKRKSMLGRNLDYEVNAKGRHWRVSHF